MMLGLEAVLPTPAEIAKTRWIREAFQSFTRDKQWLNDLHLQICRVPAPTFLEQKRAEWMAEQFRSLGARAEIDRAGNVVAWPGGEPADKLLALTSHLDTVLVPRVKEDIAVAGDGTLRGPGVSDNGAGLAALLALARILSTGGAPEEVRRQVVLIANVAEEGEGNLSGMRYLCNQSPLAGRLAAFLVLDGPGTERITYQALASRRYEIVLTGPGGHSWSDFGSPHPIHALSAVISDFLELSASDPENPRTSYNFGIFEGGSSINSIPSEARTKVDFRSTSAARLEELLTRLSGCVERALASENVRTRAGKLAARIKEIGSRPAGSLPENSPLLACLRAVDAHLGIRGRLDCASTDANIPLSLGLPAVTLGAGGQGGGAHTPGEWYSPDGRDLALKRILLVLATLLR